MIEGRCLCGAVRFEIDGNVSSFWLCHCSRCRRISGGPFAAAALCRRNAFRFVSGEDEIRTFQLESGYTRRFCGRCASPAPLVGERQVVLSPGCLDAGYAGQLARQIFVGSKAPWWSVSGDAPCFAEHAPT